MSPSLHPHPAATPLATGPSAHLALIRKAYEAFRDHDVEALLDVLAPDVHWVHPDGMSDYGLGGTEIGHEGVKDFLSRVPRVLGGMRLYPQEFLESGDRVVVLGLRDVTSVHGRTERLRFVHSWTVSEGRATRMEDIFDTVALRRLIES
ncbi:nuclear transport factor 2 family protein [Streptomyces sp. JHA26]|uniref:nuclear transport factor 2 family protein n=1 Tax=Streptomyces sp. JHA26 TaxID=1917143 RepID=UPI00098BC5AB|nr:nuclear transport factor 2 family protein [Streptomyces sp. JHA26]